MTPGVTRYHLVRDLCFSKDSRWLYAGADGGWLAMIDTASCQVRAKWQGHQGDVHTVAIVPNGILASGGPDRLVRLWDVKSALEPSASHPNELARWEAHAAAISALTFTPDGKTLVTGHTDGTIKLWDLPWLYNELKWLGLDWQLSSELDRR